MIYRFGECRVDAEARQLVVRGRVAALPPKAFALLCVLIEERPRVVPKPELLELVWPDTFVSESNLAVLIKDIRVAIGDPAVKGAFIRTHHRIGYAFAGDVVETRRLPAVPLAGASGVLHIGGRRVVIGLGTSVVGRDETCDVVINDPSISRRHATIDVKRRHAVVTDLRSKNGTFVAEKKVGRPAKLMTGESVRFGTITCEFALELPAGASTQTVEDDG